MLRLGWMLNMVPLSQLCIDYLSLSRRLISLIAQLS